MVSATVGFCIMAGVVAIGGCASADADGDRSAPQLSVERIAGIVASPDRSAADRANDLRRKPIDMLDFIGVRPGMVALDISAGGGYTTELLARAVGPTGRVYGQSQPSASPPPASPPAAATPPRRTSAMALAERAKTVPNIVAVGRPFDDPVPPELASGSLDLVTLMFNYHDFGSLGVDRAAMNKAVFAALKPGGV